MRETAQSRIQYGYRKVLVPLNREVWDQARSSYTVHIKKKGWLHDHGQRAAKGVGNGQRLHRKASTGPSAPNVWTLTGSHRSPNRPADRGLEAEHNES